MKLNIVVLLQLSFLLINGLIQSSLAQSNDTIIILPEFEVSQSRSSVFNTGRQTHVIDSTLLSNSLSKNLGDILSNGSTVFVKTYGNGGSATISIRGTEARHTSVLWNGFNINSPSLGVTDIANIPGSIANEIKLVKGGNSAVNGNASIGGTLILSNLPAKFEKNFYTLLSGELGSFGNQHIYAKTCYSNQSIVSSTKLFSNHAINDFNYSNHTKKDSPEEELTNSKTNSYGIIQDLSFKINTKHFIDASIWYQVNNREIPPIMNVPVSAANQRDSTLRIFAGYRLLLKNSMAIIKGGYFNEYQFYTDTIQNLSLLYQLTTYLSESEYLIHLNDYSTLNSGINYTYSKADISEYTQSRNRYQFSAFSNLISTPIHGWTININLRLEQVTNKNPPLSPSVGLKGNIYQELIYITANTGRNYSLPSLNDLYWVPGGNINLQPEDAWSYESGIELFENNPALPTITLVCFGSQVKNWIKWQPGAGGIYRPENISQVNTSGIETSLHFEKKFRSLTANFTTAYAYTKSVFKESDELFSENIIGKQLSYIPIHTWNSILNIFYQNFSLQCNYSYTGERYTTADNSTSLPSFHIININLEKKIEYKQHMISAFIGINNLTDSKYEVIALRPTPGRWYAGGIRIKINYIN